MIPRNEFRKCIVHCVSELYKNIGIHEGTLLISGASGLIGSTLIDCILEMNDLCSAGFKIIAIARNRKRAMDRLGLYFDRNDFEFISCDINNSIPEMGKADYILHAASNTHPLEYSSDPIGTINTNVIGTENLLEYAIMHHTKRFVFLSSVEVYGEDRDGTKGFSETDCGYLDCIQVRSGYPESKRVGECLCRAYEHKYKMDVVIPRLCRVYGPTMWPDDSKALAQFIKNAVSNENIVLKSNGKQYYSYIHVIDAVKAIFYIMDKGKSGEAYNVSSKLSDVKLIELAEKLSEISGTKVIFNLPQEEESQGYSRATTAILNNEKLRALGWKEEFDIDSGLRTTVRILKSLKNK